MPHVLIPFPDFATGERAVRRLLLEPRVPGLDVELLAIVDPLTPGKVAIFVSHATAEAQSRAAAARWLARLEPLLLDTRIPHRSDIAVGSFREMLRRAGERADIDRVLLGTRERDPLRGWRRARVARALARPAVSVS
jgi:nucleotide-binding universal stress UspA family protein